MSQKEQRNAARMVLDVPMVVESIGQPPMQLHPRVEPVYSRISAEKKGASFTAQLRDLSTNGAFVAGASLPLLSRIAFSFELQGYGPVVGVGWTMWRRNAACEVVIAGKTLSLPEGFGILFEAIPLDARMAIHNLVRQA